ncbi:MAG: hypothetical protein AABW59_01075 [archaeon]
MVDIKTELTPLRMILAKREPVELMVEIVNNTSKIQMISYDIVLGPQLAFDKGGRSNAQTKRFDEMQPGEKTRDYFDVYSRPNVENGEQPILITVMEHFNSDYKYIQSKKSKELVLRIG